MVDGSDAAAAPDQEPPDVAAAVRYAEESGTVRAHPPPLQPPSDHHRG